MMSPGLNLGEKVYCDHVYESEGVFSPDDTCFIGAFGYGKNSYDRLVEWPGWRLCRTRCIAGKMPDSIERCISLLTGAAL